MSWKAGKDQTETWYGPSYPFSEETVKRQHKFKCRNNKHEITHISVYLQEPHLKRRAGQSFSNCGLKITYLVWEWTSSLSGSVKRRINREWQRFSLSNMQRKKGSKRIEMIIKMVNEFKLTVVHFARPNPMQICAYAWIYRWTKSKKDYRQLVGTLFRK